MTPVMPHTTEEVWNFVKEPEEYVQLAEMPAVEHFDSEAQIMENWTHFMKVRSHVLKSLEEARNQKLIGKSFEAHVTLYVSEGVKQELDNLGADVREALIVSQLDIADLADAPADADDYGEVKIKVEHATGETCPRCRRITPDVGTDERFKELCASCAKIVADNFPEAVTEGLEK